LKIITAFPYLFKNLLKEKDDVEKSSDYNMKGLNLEILN